MKVPEGISVQVGYVLVSSSRAHPPRFPLTINLGLELEDPKLHYITEAGFVALCAAVDAFRAAADVATPESTST